MLYRTVILYLVVLAVMRVMGKRSVGNMAPFDLAVVIMIGATAALPIEEMKIDLVQGVVPIVVLGGLQIGLSVANLNSRWLERITQGTSTLLVRNGTILEQNMKKEHVTMADLVMSLREKEVDNLADLHEVWLEPNGKVSIIKKKDARPLTPKDLRQKTLTNLDLLLAQHQLRMKRELSRMMAEARAGHGREGRNRDGQATPHGEAEG